MAIRLKARSTTPGAVRLADNVLSELIGLPNIRKGVERGDNNLGTLEGCVDFAGTNQGTTGILVAGTFYATGWWDGVSYEAAPDFPDAGNVTTADTVNGVAGTLDMADYTLIIGVATPFDVRLGVDCYAGGPPGQWDAVSKTDVVAAAWIVVGHDQWTGGAAGEYPTTATSQAAQLVTDQEAVLASVAWIVSGHSILGQAGTFDEAARNVDPGAVNVVDGTVYRILDVAKTGTLVAGDYDAGVEDGKAIMIAALVLPATDLVDAPTMYGVNLAGYEAYYLEGTGMNLATLTAALNASTVPALVWSYVTRRLTQSPASVAATLTGTTLTLRRGDSTGPIEIALDRSVTGYAKLQFSAKKNRDDLDSEAIIAVDAAAGLTLLNAAAPTSAALGSLTGAGTTATLSLHGSATAELEITSAMWWDIQEITAGGEVYTVAEGRLQMEPDVTRAVE